MALQAYYSLVEVKLVNWNIDTKKIPKLQHRETDEIWEERKRDMEERPEVQKERKETRVKTVFTEVMGETMLKDTMLL